MVVVESKSLVLDTAKLAWPLLVLTTTLYISNPESKYERIPNMIWLQQDVCSYNWMGRASLYSMLFYVLLNWIIAVAATYQVYRWNRTAYYGDWLYAKETYIIALAIAIEGCVLVAVMYLHLWVMSYPQWYVKFDSIFVLARSTIKYLLLSQSHILYCYHELLYLFLFIPTNNTGVMKMMIHIFF